MLLGGERGRLRGIGLGGLVGQYQQRHHHAAGGGAEPVSFRGDRGLHQVAGGVLQADHGRLQVRPSLAIIS